MKQFFSIIFFLFSVCLSNILLADISENSKGKNEIVFGVVPQQEIKKIKATWQPLVDRISKDTGLFVVLKSARDIGDFQSKMLAEKFDIAYSNPLLYIIANSSVGYQAVVKEKNKKLEGIIIVRKDAGIESIEELSGKEMVFPEHAFAATVLTQAFLSNKNIKYDASFVFSHDEAYKNISSGKYVAGGGVVRTYDSLEPAVRSKLSILKKFVGITPHSFSVHPRLPQDVVGSIQRSLTGMSGDEEGRLILRNLRLNALEIAVNKDWDDVRKAMSDRLK